LASASIDPHLYTHTHLHGKGVGGESTTSIETIPSKEEHSSPQHDIRHMTRLLGSLETLTRGKVDSTSQSRVTTGHVHHSTTSKIKHTPRVEKSLRMPCEMGNRSVDEDGEEEHEDQPGLELHTLSKGTRNQGRRDDGEFKLENRWKLSPQ